MAINEPSSANLVEAIADQPAYWKKVAVMHSMCAQIHKKIHRLIKLHTRVISHVSVLSHTHIDS